MRKNIIWIWLLCFSGFVRGQNIHLLTPIDGTVVIHPSPVFTWQMSGVNQGELRYTIKIAEYDSIIGESASLNEHLIFSKTIVGNNPFQIFYYPTTAPQLSSCTRYVWQISTVHTIYTTQEPIEPLNTYTYFSTVSHFQIGGCVPSSPSSPPAPSAKLYIEPKKRIDHFVHLISDSLYVRYTEPYNSTQVSYRIYNADTVLVHSLLPVSYGLNYLTIPLSGLNIQPSTTAAPHIYMFEVKTAKGDLLRTKFEKQ